MSRRLPPRQWEIWYVGLRDGVRGEQTGEHNVLVVSSDLMRSNSSVVLVAPITTTGRTCPWVVPEVRIALSQAVRGALLLSPPRGVDPAE